MAKIQFCLIGKRLKSPLYSLSWLILISTVNTLYLLFTLASYRGDCQPFSGRCAKLQSCFLQLKVKCKNLVLV